MKKIFYWIILFCIFCLQIILIPIDLFIVSIPAWLEVTVIITVCIGLLLYLYLKRNCLKLFKIISLCLAELITIIIGLFCVFCNPYWNSIDFRTNYQYNSQNIETVMTFDEAKIDINFMMRHLNKNHPAFINGEPHEISSLYHQAIENLKNSDEITVLMLWQEMEKILSFLGDAHTTITWYSENEHYLKYIREHNSANEELIAINGENIEEIFEKNNTLLSYEMESWGYDQICTYAKRLEGLAYLGIDVAQDIIYTYQDQFGKKIDYHYTSQDFVLIDEYYNYYGQENSSDTPFVYYTIDKENNVAILTLKTCTNNKIYQDCLYDFFLAVRENKINNVVVDLRNNGGGSSLVANEFINYLDVESYQTEGYSWRFGCFMLPFKAKTHSNSIKEELSYNGKVYVMTSTSTFSSAMMFAEYIADNSLGIIVGDIPGNSPSGYGETATFETPKSKLYFTISSCDFNRIDSLANPDYINPDIKCDANIALETIYDMLSN